MVYNYSKGTILSSFDENSPSYLIERGKILSNYKAAKSEMVDMHERGKKYITKSDPSPYIIRADDRPLPSLVAGMQNFAVVLVVPMILRET